MKKYILIILAAYFNSSQAQNPNLEFKSAIKIYNLTSFEMPERNSVPSTGSFYRSDNSNIQFLHPTIALQWKSKSRNFHEIELSNFSVKTVVDRVALVDGSTGKIMYVESGGREVNTSISARYEYNFLLARKSDKKFVPFIGIGMNPYFTKHSVYPETSDGFNLSQSKTGLRTFVTPRFNYFFKSRLFLDLNIPFCISDIHVGESVNRNPVIPVPQQTLTNFDYTFIPSFYSIRLGLV